jgi:hypothetical protein
MDIAFASGGRKRKNKTIGKTKKRKNVKKEQRMKNKSRCK